MRTCSGTLLRFFVVTYQLSRREGTTRRRALVLAVVFTGLIWRDQRDKERTRSGPSSGKDLPQPRLPVA